MCLRLSLLVLLFSAANTPAQTPRATPHPVTDEDVTKFLIERDMQSKFDAITSDVYGLHLDLEAQKALIEKLQDEVKALQTEIASLKAKSVNPHDGK
jgi:hypothetical protein